MRRALPGTLALLSLLWFLAPASAEPESDKIAAEPAPLGEIERDAFALADKIDQYIAERQKEAKTQAAPLSDDSEFLRRVSLDLAGRIPALGLARDFPQISSTQKRRELLRLLVKDPRFAEHFAVVWRHLLLPPPNNTAFGQNPGQYDAFERFLRDELNRPLARFDRIARPLVLGANGGQPGQVFYQAYENKIENLAGATARLFLGVKLECAQCHDHPFASWRRKQFWEYAAFFSGVRRRSKDVKGGREITIPGTNKVVKIRFPDGTEPKFENAAEARGVLLEWMTAADNPFFAKATVNRMWEYFFGVGLIDPLDEPSEDNPPSHPELLDELAKEFIAHQFDLRFLTLAITASQTYQRSSALTHESQKDPRLFARALVRGLSAEQVLDSMSRAAALGDYELGSGSNMGVDQFGRPVRSLRSEFFDRFPLQAKKSEAATSILQALFLMNSDVMETLIDTHKNKNLELLRIGDKRVSTSKRVEQLFLLTLTRLPTAQERARLVEYIDKGGPSGDSRQAVSDVFWALLNSSEFALNH
jgi:hypothetical protein